MRFWLLIMLLFPATSLAGEIDNTCAPFYQALLHLPHDTLDHSEGLFTSQWSHHCVEGCVLTMLTNTALLGGQSLSDLSGDPGTPLYDEGWRSNPAYNSDEPGTSLVGLEKDGALCLVYTLQPSFVDDSGKIIRDDAIKVHVECPSAIISEGPCPGEEECGGPCN
ncbi:MAG: hypothetical protein ACWGOL_08150 [Desulfuromonadales bacterium]